MNLNGDNADVVYESLFEIMSRSQKYLLLVVVHEVLLQHVSSHKNADTAVEATEKKERTGALWVMEVDNIFKSWEEGESSPFV